MQFAKKKFVYSLKYDMGRICPLEVIKHKLMYLNKVAFSMFLNRV